MPESPVVVIGGGIVGLSVAWHLHRRGEPVVLLERGRFAGTASTGNAGLIACGHAPMPKPGLVVTGLRMMLDPAAPLYVRPRLDPALLRWMLAFRRACRPEAFARSMEVLARLGHAARECIEAMLEEAAIEAEYRPRGWLEVYRTEEGGARVTREARHEEELGFVVDHLDGAALRAMEPAFRDDVLGAAHHRDSAFADPEAVVLGLAAQLRKRGVSLREDSPCTGIETAGGAIVAVRCGEERIPTSRAVLAAGAWSTPIARAIGLEVPLEGGKGYHCTVPDPGLRTAAVCSETYVACTPMRGGLRLAGTVEFDGLRLRIAERRLARLPAGAALYLRDLDVAEPRDAWSGLRPCTGDGLPIVGPSRVAGLWLATGHAMMGFCLGPITARTLVAWMLDGAPDLDVAALHPSRFGG